MKRGTTCWVNLEPVAPLELGKTTPAIVFSSSYLNLALQSVVVIPLSSQSPEIRPLGLRPGLPRGKTSYAVLPGIQQVGMARLQEVVGVAVAADMERLNEALTLHLSE
jgi:mRNA-degrading endonuclease toxin of MazEF toxin-antitoxin module